MDCPDFRLTYGSVHHILLALCIPVCLLLLMWASMPKIVLAWLLVFIFGVDETVNDSKLQCQCLCFFMLEKIITADMLPQNCDNANYDVQKKALMEKNKLK